MPCLGGRRYFVGGPRGKLHQPNFNHLAILNVAAFVAVLSQSAIRVIFKRQQYFRSNRAFKTNAIHDDTYNVLCMHIKTYEQFPFNMLAA